MRTIQLDAGTAYDLGGDLSGVPTWGGGTVTHTASINDRRIGWVGNGREFDGCGFRIERWWACWREEGDTAARWTSDLEFRSRAAALAALRAQLAAVTA